MKIFIIDDRGGRIPAIEYGGTERVIWGLGKELNAMGHEVTYLVPEGSSCPFAKVIFRDFSKTLQEQVPTDIDVIHINYKPPVPFSKPYLVTVHGNPLPEEELDINSVFISENQAKRYNSEIFVHNGLSWEDYPRPNLSQNRTGYHFLGKASWSVKNLSGAMKIAEKTGEYFHIIGGKRWSKRVIKDSFFQLWNRKMHFHGFLNDVEKTKILQNSKALIFPVLWHEPFGLAIIESFYAGCAVFGTPNGSLAELITPQTGATGNSNDEILAAMTSFDFNPVKCHEYARENFNSRLMAQKYEKLYEKVFAGERLNEAVPSYNESLNIIPEFT